MATVDTVMNIIIGVVLLGGVSVVGFFIFTMMKFRHRIILKEVGSDGRKIHYFDKFMIKKDKNGVHWYRLFKKKIDLPMAPAEAIEIDKKGNYVVHAYLLEGDQIVFSKDTARPIPQEILKIRNIKDRKKAIATYVGNNDNVINSWESLTNVQRGLQCNKLKEAYERKRKGVMEYVPLALGLGAIVIVVIGMLAFVPSAIEEVTKMTNEIGGKVVQSQELQKETMEILRDIKLNVQSIKGSQEITPAPD